MTPVAALLLAGAAEAAFAGVPNVRIHWYEVEGATPTAIRASIDARRPVDPGDGAAVDALTRWSMTWRWLGSPADPCGLSHAVVDFAAGVQLPRLRTRVDARTRAAWDRYVAALARHEARHVRAAHAGRAQVLAAVKGATCATANVAGEAALARLREGDRALDRATDHGKAEGAVYP